MTPKEFFEFAKLYNGNDCLIWPFKKGRYGHMKQNGKDVSVHRSICIAVHGEPPTDEHQAAHKCHNGVCCNPNHIRWLTPSQNCLENSRKGETNGRAILSETKVIEIRKKYIDSGAKHGILSKLAIEYNMAVNTIFDIVNKRSWKHL